MSQTGYHTFAMNISPDISRIKGNQTMKLSQSVELSLKNHEQNVMDKLFPDSFITM